MLHFFNRLLGKISSKHVSIAKRTHFTGVAIEKQIIVRDKIPLGKNRVQEVCHKFTFFIKTNKETKRKLNEIYSTYSNNNQYKTIVQKSHIGNWFYTDYLFADSLSICYTDADDLFCNLGFLTIDPKIFSTNYDFSNTNESYAEFMLQNISEETCNRYLRDVLKKEVKIFIDDCTKIMSY